VILFFRLFILVFFFRKAFLNSDTDDASTRFVLVLYLKFYGKT